MYINSWGNRVDVDELGNEYDDSDIMYELSREREILSDWEEIELLSLYED